MKRRHRQLVYLIGSLLLPVCTFAADPPAKPDQPTQAQDRPQSMSLPTPPTGEATGWPGASPLFSYDAGKARLTRQEEERKRVESALPAGHDKSFYRDELHSLGYRLTSVNKENSTYVEYEILKDGHSYEVQIALDQESGRAKQVKVAPNVWKARGTEQAIRESQGR